MPLSKGSRERLLSDVAEAAGQRHDAALAADRARRIRDLAAIVAYDKRFDFDTESQCLEAALIRAARIVDTLDALPVPAKEGER
jgi:hypothetical protein